MAHIALFHSVLGLRSVELFAAERLRRGGHEVVTPDLFDGETASALDGGFELVDRIGWAAVVKSARQTLPAHWRPLPIMAANRGARHTT